MKVKSQFGKTAILAATLAVGVGTISVEAQDVLRRPRIKNIIVLISDGCGYNAFDAATYYEYGYRGAQPYEKAVDGWQKFGMSTYSAWNGYNSKLNSEYFKYMDKEPTDSASAATAMSTGLKNDDGTIGVGIAKTVGMAATPDPLLHFSEVAKAQGKAIGVITSVPITHATPAGFIAHNASRNSYAQIAQEMILDSQADVIMGAGHPEFSDSGTAVTPTDSTAKYVGGLALWNQLTLDDGRTTFTAIPDMSTSNTPVASSEKDRTVQDVDGDGTPDAWDVIQSKAGFEALAVAGTTPKRVLGVAQVASTLQQSRLPAADRNGDGIVDGKDAQVGAYVEPMNMNVPSLETMTKAALNVLDNNPNGLFLMVEGGAVDWAGHANQPGRIVEEQVDFNAACKAVIAWVHANSNWNETLVIVTTDHETGHITNLVNKGKGVQPAMVFNSGEHTNQIVPFFVKGRYAYLFQRYAYRSYDPYEQKYYLDNTNLAQVCFYLLGFGSLTR